MTLNRKRVALAGIAAVETAAEPSLALFARAVRELPLVGMTERVVADRMRGSEGFAQIVVRDLERRARRVTPDTGKAIRLQLDAYRVLVRGLASWSAWWSRSGFARGDRPRGQSRTPGRSRRARAGAVP
jgi:hypothetical protein